MQKTLFIKLSIIAGLCFLFTVGLVMFSSVITERQRYSDKVVKEIASQNVNPQEVITPFIAVPTTVTPVCNQPTDAKAPKVNCPEPYVQIKTLLANQTSSTQNVEVSTDTYQRGIYHATSFKGDINFNQSYIPKTFDPSTDAEPLAKNVAKLERTVHWQNARLIIPVSDLRGVVTLPTVTIDKKTIKATYPQSQMIEGLSYIEATLPYDILAKFDQPTTQSIDTTQSSANSTIASESNALNPDEKSAKAFTLTVDLDLSGISNLNIVPTGKNFEVSMTSNWHSPNFMGSALPNAKTITDNGFDANWQNQYLTVENNQLLTSCLSRKNYGCGIESSASLTNHSYSEPYGKDVYVSAEIASSGVDSVRLNKFGISFAEPNDVYLQTERTMKYALLLVLVSFGTFFLFEIIKSNRIHPIQYLLVGSALLVFYVLLLPLAEQIAFLHAYAIAASACVGLIGWYSFYVLGNVKRALIFTAILSSLYAAFYGILTTEDLNLLLGAVFCFVLLASVMVMTRKIDWYKVA